MKTNTRNRWLAITGLVIAAAALCQTSPRVSISLSTRSASFRAGEDVRVDLIVKNVSSEPTKILVARGAGGEADAANTIEVRDASGNLLPRIDDRIIDTGQRKIVIGKRWASRSEVMLKPGEEYRDYCVLNRLFRLQEAGTYTVSARQEVPVVTDGADTKFIEVKSNTIRFEVTK